MMHDAGFRRMLPDQSSGSVHTFGTARHPNIANPIPSKRVCFYKSGDPQFSGLRMVINNRTFKTFDALLDSLSKKVPLPFGVRNITTPQGVHAIYTLDDLEDGKSYICSDSRKVKPFNLAMARKKLPPWYHARPASSRRRTVQQARGGAAGHDLLLMRTPKRLLVFRNGEPSLRRTVVLQRRTTATFRSILEYLSELMQFHVVKLHTPDGRRVDGLPALILCSGTVVAAGREPFRPANYIAHKSPAPLRLPTNRIGVRRLKALNRQKKALLYPANARHFSPSSESYIVNRIHSAIAGSSCELPTHPTNSIDLESGHLLESVAETEADTCLSNGGEGQGCSLPTEDDIEKSFRVNQDGSMTVEMRVRLTIKEEETLHWTTTLTRSSVANQLTCLPEPEPEIPLPEPNTLVSQNSVSSYDTVNKDRNKDNEDDDDEPPSFGSTGLSQNSSEECDRKVHSGGSSPLRAPSPVQKLTRKKQPSMESVTSVRAGVQEDFVGSYTFAEQTQNLAVTEQYRMVTQSNARPVPKPRRFGSVDAYKPRHATSFKSGLAEILQIESSREEVTETVLHIYEQQTCQDNYHANMWRHGSSTSGAPFCRPATSETGRFSSGNDYESELWRPSTASESISIWRAESVSVRSDITVPLPPTHAVLATNRQRGVNVGKEKPQQRDKRIPVKPKVINKRFSRLTSPSKRQKEQSESSAPATEKRKKTKIYSSAGFIKSIYGGKSKGVAKPRKKPVSVAAKSTIPADHTPKQIPRDPQSGNRLEVSPPEMSPPRGVLTRQPSMHRERKSDVAESVPLPALKSSSAVTKQYVEKWLERSQASPADDAEAESQRGEEEAKGERLALQSVKQRIKSFETKSAPVVERVPPQSIQNTVNEKKEQVGPLKNAVINPITPKIQVGSEAETELNPVKVSAQKEMPLNSVSVDLPLPPPPPPAESYMETQMELNAAEVPPEWNPDDSMPSEASSPLYRHSSMSSETSDPTSGSPASDKTQSPCEEDAMDVTSPEDAPDTPTEAPLQRAPSMKRAPLVSNHSLERKMSLRKACLDNYAVCNEIAAETSSVSVDANGNAQPSDAEPSGVKAEEKQYLDLRASPSCGTSVSPASLSSEGRMSSASVSSSDAATPNPPLKEEEALQTQQEVRSPKPAVKKVKIVTSPSPDRKPQTKKATSELPNNSPKPVHHPRDKSMSPKVGPRKVITPNASPSPDRKLRKPDLQKKLSPYSQSLDIVSPPARHKTNKKTLSRNLSSDNTPETIRRQTPSLTKQTEKSAEAEEKITVNDERIHDNQLNEMDDLRKAGYETVTQPLNIANQPNMTPVLEKICYSIKSIRAVTQSKRPSCLEKSNSLPDFSSHVASTFGSSSKALLAFLSVMTLRDAIANLDAQGLNANDVSCAEALKMIDSLLEIARIEDSHTLQSSLADLQRSTSKQLLDSWRGFQELGSRSTTPNYSDGGETPEQDCGIDEIMEGLDIPETLKEELASFSLQKISETPCEEENLEMSQNGDANEAQIKANEEEEVKVDVRSAIKKFTDIEQLKRANVPLKTNTGMREKEENNAVKSPPDELESDEKPIYCRVVFEQKGKTVVKPCEELNRGKMNGAVSTDEPEEEEEEEDCGLEENQSEESINHNVFLHDDESASDDGEQRTSNLKHEESTESSSDSGKQQQSSEEELEVEYEDGKCKSEEEKEEEGEEEEESINNNDFLHEDDSVSDDGEQKISNLQHKESADSSSESGKQQQSSEEELEVEFEDGEYKEEEAPLPNNFAEQNGSAKGSISESVSEEEPPEAEHPERIGKNPESDSENPPRSDPSSSEEEQPEIQCENLSESPPETAQERKTSSTMPKISENTGDSDVDEAPSSSEGEEEQPESKELMVIVEESLCEEEQECLEAEELLNVHEEEALKTSKDSSDSEDPHVEEMQITARGNLSNLIQDQDPIIVKDSCSLIEEDLEKRCGFDMEGEEEEEDSGNDHSSCEEAPEQCKEEDQQMRCSTEEELSIFDKDSSSSEEERGGPERCPEERAVPPVPKLSENGVASQSVAERVSLLEKQVKTTTEVSASRCFSQRHLASDGEDLSCAGAASQAAGFCTRSAPQSSLSFSYDSGGVITSEPESSRVRSIREMFLARSAAELQHGGGGGEPRAELADLRAETSISGGYQSQTSSELSSGEEDSSKTTIAKGFVRRAIERLYGKNEAEPEEPVSETPPSASKKEKKRARSSIFSPFHIARSKAVSELSYFNSTNALDTLTEATRCIAFNAQVGPGDSVPIDAGRWLLRENALIRKSVSDPVGINKSFAPKVGGGELADAEESPPYSLFSTSSEPEEEKKKAFTRKCTYFSLPHTSDSDACQEEPSVAEVKDGGEKPWAERNGALPAADFKLMDNKVHPLVEGPPDGEAVVVQPGKGHGVVNRRIPEPDMLDLLYNFCGQNCPFL